MTVVSLCWPKKRLVHGQCSPNYRTSSSDRWSWCWGLVEIQVPLEPVLSKVREGRQRLGWQLTPVVVHDHGHGVAIAFRVPVDQLYTACALVEWALNLTTSWEDVLTGE